MCIVILKLKQLIAHICVRAKRGSKYCGLIPALPFKETIIIHNVYFFKVSAYDIFRSKVRLKRKSQKERHKRERERERERERKGDSEVITPCIQFFIRLCSSVSSYYLK